MIENIVIGQPIVPVFELLAYDLHDWLHNESKQTLFTETRYLPAILKEAGIVASTSEVRRNRPELNVELNELDCIDLRWGKKRVYIVIGK